MTCGIYCIENLKNGKKYVGQSLKIEGRFNQHIHDLQLSSHKNSHLQGAWNQYGSKNFKFYIIEECSGRELNAREKFYVEEWNTISPAGYNFMEGGGKQRKKYNASSKYLGVQSVNGRYFICQMLSEQGLDFKGYIGRYKKEEWAAMAYDYAALQIYGKRCRLNFPEFRKTYLEINKDIHTGLPMYPEEYLKYLDNHYFEYLEFWIDTKLEAGEEKPIFWCDKFLRR